MFNFEKLKIYQKSLVFVNDVYSLTELWPKTEVFGLTGQFRRAAVSISLNIAEGSGRTKKDFRHFLDMARTSCYECIPLLEVAKARQYINEETFVAYYKSIEELAKMISALKRAIGP